MDKLKEIIAYIIKNYCHKNELSNARLTKIVYLSDWHQSIHYKKQITDLNWYFDNYGPFLPDILNKAKQYTNIFNCELTENIYGNPKIIFSLKDDSYVSDLNEQEKKSIDHIINITEKLNWNDFIKLVYSTHPIATSNRYTHLNLVEKAIEYNKVKNYS